MLLPLVFIHSDWCNGGSNETAYCPSLLLQLAEISGIYGDSKTFPDKPTVGTADETFAAFQNLINAYGTNVTIGEIQSLVEQYFVSLVADSRRGLC